MEEAKADGLAVLALGTGGRVYQNNNDLAAGSRFLSAVPHDGKYHALKVRLTGGRHGSVQARMGYNAPDKEPPAELVRQQDRDRILMGSDAPADVAVRVTAEPGKGNSGPRRGREGRVRSEPPEL